ncbi:3-oxoacyl-ACP reductase [Salipaludibacillus keqinensis]|uniref:3-oxoacyl-ACP reductase n=1 Tax=Salipaludibacillus keqinensis TaxID=2045207 RepID=A0A323TGG0_9BACI|nr:SDR family oxidoreductase [Salipaludibacillus keqinensis]PYZ92647.1 3-oxoacyl-ACP reductase [Salipaludibacillus keqinensis]
MSLHLQGKNVLVLASSKGLGRATAEAYANAGANVMITSRSEENLQKTAGEMSATADGVVAYHRCDVSKTEDLKQLMEATIAKFGSLDVLVNNAGGPPPGGFEDLTDDDWEYAFQLTLMSIVRTIRYALPYLKESKGRIVNITSSSIKEPIDGLMLSNVYRMGIVGLAKTLSNELASEGVLINTVGPGRIDTERLRTLEGKRAEALQTTPEQVRKNTEANIPLGRYGTPEEFANTVLFLGSGLNTYVTGQMFVADGGMTSSY